eukprot:s5088_g1.t1
MVVKIALLLAKIPSKLGRHSWASYKVLELLGLLRHGKTHCFVEEIVMRLEHLRLLGLSFKSLADERNSGARCKTSPAEKTCSKQAANVEDVPSHLECAICWKLLLEPVSVPCGHTFCQGCLNQALDYRS